MKTIILPVHLLRRAYIEVFWLLLQFLFIVLVVLSPYFTDPDVQIYVLCLTNCVSLSKSVVQPNKQHIMALRRGLLRNTIYHAKKKERLLMNIKGQRASTSLRVNSQVPCQSKSHCINSMMFTMITKFLERFKNFIRKSPPYSLRSRQVKRTLVEPACVMSS